MTEHFNYRTVIVWFEQLICIPVFLIKLLLIHKVVHLKFRHNQTLLCKSKNSLSKQKQKLKCGE